MEAKDLSNVSNPAAFGVEWERDGSSCQLVNLRGTDGLLFGLRVEGRTDWVTTPVEEPGRFLTGVPSTFAEFRTAALAFANG